MNESGVYVSGNTYSGGKERVVYWKDGQLQMLSAGTKYAAGTSIFVSRTLVK